VSLPTAAPPFSPTRSSAAAAPAAKLNGSSSSIAAAAAAAAAADSSRSRPTVVAAATAQQQRRRPQNALGQQTITLPLVCAVEPVPGLLPRQLVPSHWASLRGTPSSSGSSGFIVHQAAVSLLATALSAHTIARFRYENTKEAGRMRELPNSSNCYKLTAMHMIECIWTCVALLIFAAVLLSCLTVCI
jgi:hypothetical protein